jgi:type II restriction/modification system DNA methylase subunit YeeA
VHRVAWSKEHLEENLTFVRESLGANRGEQSRDTVRRYLAEGFFKDHLKTYKRRPIYWLFSSGKQRAFQCLVYLHCYHEGTLSRMRTKYVIPLQGKLAARTEHLANDAQQASLLVFAEKLRHYTDMHISLDLDDGVKMNYGKFSDLLAEVRAVCGKDED